MTPEEEQQMRAAVMRNLQQSQPPPGMMNQSAAPAPSADAAIAARSFAGPERRIGQQMQYANMLRGKAAPKGKTVGPSGLYVGPNWGESLEYALNQGVGGYMAGRANKQSANLDTAREETAAAGAREEARKLQEARDFTSGERVAGQDFRAGESGLARSANKLEKGISRTFQNEQRALRDAAALGRQEDAQDFTAGAQDVSTMVDPKNPGKGTFDVKVDREGKRTLKDGSAAPDGAVDYNTWEDNRRQELAALNVGDDKALTRAGEKLDISLKQYGKDLQKSLLPRVGRNIAEVDRMMALLPKDKDGNITQVPGMGGLYNVSGVGQALSAMESDANGVDASQFRAAVQNLLNTEIRTQSGAAVTQPEMVRNAIGLSSDWASTDEDFLANWPKIKTAIGAIQKNFDNAYGPEVVEIYGLRDGGEAVTSREYLERKADAKKAEAAANKDPAEMTEEELDAYLASQGL